MTPKKEPEGFWDCLAAFAVAGKAFGKAFAKLGKAWQNLKFKHIFVVMAIYLGGDGGLNHFRIWNTIWSPVTSHSARVVQDSVNKVAGYGAHRRTSDSLTQAKLNILIGGIDTVKIGINYLAYHTGNSEGLHRRLHPDQMEPNVFPKSNSPASNLGKLDNFRITQRPDQYTSKGAKHEVPQ